MYSAQLASGSYVKFDSSSEWVVRQYALSPKMPAIWVGGLPKLAQDVQLEVTRPPTRFVALS